jgi:DNA-binding transcriptional MerR regulator
VEKSPEAFRTISEVADHLDIPAHVLRFWESRFPQIRPVKRAGGRRYYRPTDVALLAGIRRLLHDEGLTIRGVQKILREQGVRHVAALAEGPILTLAVADQTVEDIQDDAAEASLQAEPAQAAEAAPKAPAAEPPPVRASMPDLPLFAPVTAALAAAVPPRAETPAPPAQAATADAPPAGSAAESAPPPAPEAPETDEAPLAQRLRALPRAPLRDRLDRLSPVVTRLSGLREQLADRGHVPRR